ncbi:MAG: hypothetical protein ACFB3T_07605 [Geminicoccaceae bacterium]
MAARPGQDLLNEAGAFWDSLAGSPFWTGPTITDWIVAASALATAGAAIWAAYIASRGLHSWRRSKELEVLQCIYQNMLQLRRGMAPYVDDLKAQTDHIFSFFNDDSSAPRVHKTITNFKKFIEDNRDLAKKIGDESRVAGVVYADRKTGLKVRDLGLQFVYEFGNIREAIDTMDQKFTDRRQGMDHYLSYLRTDGALDATWNRLRSCVDGVRDVFYAL